MGGLHSKKVKQKQKLPINKDTRNAKNTKEAVANYGKANDLTGIPSNAEGTSEQLAPTQLINDQVEPSNGNEAVLIRRHQVSAVDGQEQLTDNAGDISQYADPVKLVPYPPFTVRVTKSHRGAVKPKDEETSTPTPLLQQATTARPTTGHTDVNITAGKYDVMSDILHQLISEQIKLMPTAQVPQNTNPTVPVQQQTDRQVIYCYTQPEEGKNFPPSQQRPAAKETTEVQTVREVADTVHSCKVFTSVQLPAQMFCKDASPQEECNFGSKGQQEVIPACRIWRESARPAENLHTEEAGKQAKENLNKFQNQSSSCGASNVNKASTDFISHATDKAQQSKPTNTSTTPFAQVPATKPTRPEGRSTQMATQPTAQVSNNENEQKQCLNHHSATNVIPVDYHYCSIPKSERNRANAARLRLRKKLAKKLKAQRKHGRTSTQQGVEVPVTTVAEHSQQGCTAMEENLGKKHAGPQLMPETNKSDYRNTLSCIQTVNMKVEAAHVPIVEEKPIAAPNNAGTHNLVTTATDTNVKLRRQCEPKISLPEDTAVRPKKNCTPKDFDQDQPKNTVNVTMKEEINRKNGQIEKQEQASTPVTPEHKVCAKGRWHQFTVNQSCSHKAHCKHNPGKDLPPNVKKWYEESPEYEPPWVTTARLAACLALRQMQNDDEGDQE